MLKKLKKLYLLIVWQFGVDPRRALKAIVGIPRFFNNYFVFRRSYEGRIDFFPCLQDWHEESGVTKEEYFLQDLHVARKIQIANPLKHVDIGSRVDGFVANVASFRDVEVFDIRPNTAEISGITFKQADLMSMSESLLEYCDSLSCLHALEHFGLGRYGDPIEPHGYLSAIKNMSNILKKSGLFYLSVPIGIERVEFNAHRIFNPKKLVLIAKDNNLMLKDFAWIGESKLLNQSNNFEQDMDTLESQSYSLGIFIFSKN